MIQWLRWSSGSQLALKAYILDSELTIYTASLIPPAFDILTDRLLRDDKLLTPTFNNISEANMAQPGLQPLPSSPPPCSLSGSSATLSFSLLLWSNKINPSSLDGQEARKRSQSSGFWHQQWLHKASTSLFPSSACAKQKALWLQEAGGQPRVLSGHLLLPSSQSGWTREILL